MRGPTILLLALVAALAVVEVAANVVLRPQAGPLALAAVLEAHLLVLGAVAGVIAAASGGAMGRLGAWVRLVAVVVVVVAVVRLGGEWWSPGADAPPAGATTIEVASWNLELGARATEASLDGIRDLDADLVALQELTPNVAEAIGADPELDARFPYRILEPRDGVAGMGLLSRLPLVIGGYETGPLVLSADLLLPDGTSVRVLNVHPFSPGRVRWGVLPGIDTVRRDADLARIRAAVEAAGDPSTVLLIGDLNASPLEPGYGAVATGLRDAHADAGTGPGFTWRPAPFDRLPLGLLRIDVVLTGDALRPLSASSECSIPGDHCRLSVSLAVEPGH